MGRFRLSTRKYFMDVVPVSKCHKTYSILVTAMASTNQQRLSKTASKLLLFFLDTTLDGYGATGCINKKGEADTLIVRLYDTLSLLSETKTGGAWWVLYHKHHNDCSIASGDDDDPMLFLCGSGGGCMRYQNRYGGSGRRTTTTTGE